MQGEQVSPDEENSPAGQVSVSVWSAVGFFPGGADSQAKDSSALEYFEGPSLAQAVHCVAFPPIDAKPALQLSQTTSELVVHSLALYFPAWHVEQVRQDDCDERSEGNIGCLVVGVACNFAVFLELLQTCSVLTFLDSDWKVDFATQFVLTFSKQAEPGGHGSHTVSDVEVQVEVIYEPAGHVEHVRQEDLVELG